LETLFLPMWVEGTVSGSSYIRRTLRTASWERAQGLAGQIEPADDPQAPPEKTEQPVTIQQAVDEYLADAKPRDLSEATLYKLDIIFRKQFLTLAKSEGYSLLRELDLRAVEAFGSRWKDGGLAKKKKQERSRVSSGSVSAPGGLPQARPSISIGSSSPESEPAQNCCRAGRCVFTPTLSWREHGLALIEFHLCE
jgi:hypothetical protein